MNGLDQQIDQDLQQNRKLLYAIMIVLISMSALIYKFYTVQKRENSALKIKLISLNKTRNITPWQGLITRPQISPTVTPNTIVTDKVTTKSASTIREPSKILTIQNDQPIQNLSTQELANILNLRMIEVKSLDYDGLEKNIEIANEIMSREPDSYSAYKAKLISLLIEEGKLNRLIDDNEVNSILETMASFDLSGNSATQREATLIANTTNEISTLTNSLNDLAAQRQAIEYEMEYQDTNTPETRALEIERQNLLSKEDDLANRITELNNNLNSGFPEGQYLNEDVVQIPFLRMMAKKDYEGVIDNAQTFIDQFPNSPDGYYFLIKAYEASGRHEEALRVIEEDPRLTTETRNLLQKRLQNFSAMDAKNYWESLNF